MDKINNGIVFSDDIERIISGKNAFDYSYGVVPNSSFIEYLRDDFKFDVKNIFDGNVTIISEEEMMDVNRLIDGWFPHCIFR